MKILVTAATQAELGPYLHYLRENAAELTGQGSSDICSVYGTSMHELHILISGVGLTATTYSLTRILASQTFDLVLQAGVCGSFDRNVAPGTVVLVQSEQFGDLGAEDQEHFLDLFDLGLAGPDDFPFSGGRLDCPLHLLPFSPSLQTVSGLTVHRVSGREETIRERAARWNCQTETMEGAAFHYVCLREQVVFAQVRAVSNYVEPRNRQGWKMAEAIAALNQWLIQFTNDAA